MAIDRRGFLKGSAAQVALVGVGILSLLSKAKSADVHGEEIAKGRTGFKRGIILGFLNPMTIPFWLMVTAYIQNHDIIPLEGTAYWFYQIHVAAKVAKLLRS